MDGKPIRLSGTSYAVLSLLSHLGESTPYDLKQAMSESVDNFWPVPHTTFYAEPARLAAGGYLSERQEQHGRRRKLYALTDAGRTALAAWAARPDAAPPQLRDEALLKIFAGGDPGAVMRARRPWFEHKLAEFEAKLEGNPWELDEHSHARLTLIAGIAYHRHLLAAVDGYLAALDAADVAPDAAADDAAA